MRKIITRDKPRPKCYNRSRAMKSLSFLLVCTVAACGAAFAQDSTPVAPTPAPEADAVYASASPRKLPNIGVNVSAYFPTSSKTRRTFGSSWTSIGVGLGSSLVSKARIYPDFNLFRQKDDGDRLFAVTAGARYLKPLGSAIDLANPPKFAPYVGLGVSAVYANVDAPSTNTDDSGFGFGGNVTLGTTLGRTFFAEGRYNLFSQAADFNLSGAQILVGARF